MHRKPLLILGITLAAATLMPFSDPIWIPLASGYTFFYFFFMLSEFFPPKRMPKLILFQCFSLIPLYFFMWFNGVKAGTIGLTLVNLPVNACLSLALFTFGTVLHIYWFYVRRPENPFGIRVPKTLHIAFSASTALAEETWHRGFLLFLAASALGAPAGAMLSTVIFSAPHFRRNKFSGVLSFIFAFFSAVLVLFTGNLVGLILAHFLFNMFNNYMICPNGKDLHTIRK
jgi:membrane protease YdiL (CAAX protease family)